MTPVSLFWDTNMVAVTSCENTLYDLVCTLLLEKLYLDALRKLRAPKIESVEILSQIVTEIGLIC